MSKDLHKGKNIIPKLDEKKKNNITYTNEKTGKKKTKTKIGNEVLDNKEYSKRIGDYILLEELGQGTFSKVTKAIHLITSQQVAVKILDKEKIEDDIDIERIIREMEILKSIYHPNIVQMYENYSTIHNFYLMMELVGGGDLFDFINKNNYLSENIACHFFRQLISVLEYLNSLGISHRDIKPENILLDSYYQNIKVIDFGLSNYSKNNELLISSCGSPCYASPEMLSGNPYNGAGTDIWSSGIVLYSMLVGSLPFDDTELEKLYEQIKKGIFYIPSTLSLEAIDLIKRLLNVDPKRRIGIQEIKKHQWFNMGQNTLYRGINISKEDFPCNEYVVQFIMENFFKDDKNINHDLITNMIKKNTCNKYTSTYYLAKKNILRINDEETINKINLITRNVKLMKTIETSNEKGNSFDNNESKSKIKNRLLKILVEDDKEIEKKKEVNYGTIITAENYNKNRNYTDLNDNFLNYNNIKIINNDVSNIKKNLILNDKIRKDNKRNIEDNNYSSYTEKINKPKSIILPKGKKLSPTQYNKIKYFNKINTYNSHQKIKPKNRNMILYQTNNSNNSFHLLNLLMEGNELNKTKQSPLIHYKFSINTEPNKKKGVKENMLTGLLTSKVNYNSSINSEHDKARTIMKPRNNNTLKNDINNKDKNKKPKIYKHIVLYKRKIVNNSLEDNRSCGMNMKNTIVVDRRSKRVVRNDKNIKNPKRNQSIKIKKIIMSDSNTLMQKFSHQRNFSTSFKSKKIYNKTKFNNLHVHNINSSFLKKYFDVNITRRKSDNSHNKMNRFIQINDKFSFKKTFKVDSKLAKQMKKEYYICNNSQNVININMILRQNKNKYKNRNNNSVLSTESFKINTTPRI